MKEYKVWAFARSAAPNLPALEEQLAEVMREADRRGYIIVNSCIVCLFKTLEIVRNVSYYAFGSRAVILP